MLCFFKDKLVFSARIALATAYQKERRINRSGEQGNKKKK